MSAVSICRAVCITLENKGCGKLDRRSCFEFQVLDRDPARLKQAMADLGMTCPVIMKPRVACGTPESHAMALLLQPEGITEAHVTLPASVQVSMIAICIRLPTLRFSPIVNSVALEN